MCIDRFLLPGSLTTNKIRGHLEKAALAKQGSTSADASTQGGKTLAES